MFVFGLVRMELLITWRDWFYFCAMSSLPPVSSSTKFPRVSNWNYSQIYQVITQKCPKHIIILVFHRTTKWYGRGTSTQKQCRRRIFLCLKMEKNNHQMSWKKEQKSAIWFWLNPHPKQRDLSERFLSMNEGGSLMKTGFFYNVLWSHISVAFFRLFVWHLMFYILHIICERV